MKISYDSEVDALYIRLLDGDYECRNVHLSDDIALNLGPQELLVGIEILNASAHIGNGEVPGVELDNIKLVESK